METAENFLKASFRILIMVGFISLIVLAGMLESGKFDTKTVLISYSGQGEKSSKHRKLIGEENYGVDRPMSDLDQFMSKRRVPNRSDPIHNRRAGNSRRPPGQA